MRRCLLSCLTFALLLAGCGLNNDPAAPLDQIGELEQARERWHSLGLTAYTYAYDRECHCPPEFTEPVDVSVRDEVVVQVRSLATGELAPPERLNAFKTVPELFDLIGAGLRRARPTRVVAIYDGTSGLPVDCLIDWLDWVDEENAWTAGDLRPE